MSMTSMSRLTGAMTYWQWVTSSPGSMSWTVRASTRVYPSASGGRMNAPVSDDVFADGPLELSGFFPDPAVPSLELHAEMNRVAKMAMECAFRMNRSLPSRLDSCCYWVSGAEPVMHPVGDPTT